MKRTNTIFSVAFLAAAVFFAFSPPTQAQSFSVSALSATETGKAGNYIDVHVDVTNMTFQPLTLRVQRVKNDLPEGWSSSVCLVNCFSPLADDVTDVLGANETYPLKLSFETSATPGSGETEIKLSNNMSQDEFATIRFTAVSKTLSISQVGAPKSVTLAQNYPNPVSFSANTVTQISYTIPKSSHVSLRIYNLIGREVRSLVSENRNAGIYTETWDGRNNDGAIVPPGIYLYKMTSGSSNLTRRLVVTR